MPNFDTHTIFDVVTSAVTLGWLIIGLLIKSSLKGISVDQEKNKAELLANQTKLKEDLMVHQAKTKEELIAADNSLKIDMAVHKKEDDGRFDLVASNMSQLKETMARIENKLNS